MAVILRDGSFTFNGLFKVRSAATVRRAASGESNWTAPPGARPASAMATTREVAPNLTNIANCEHKLSPQRTWRRLYPAHKGSFLAWNIPRSLVESDEMARSMCAARGLKVNLRPAEKGSNPPAPAKIMRETRKGIRSGGNAAGGIRCRYDSWQPHVAPVPE